MTGTLVDDLRQLIGQSLLPLLAGDTSGICLVDPPGHPNVGDSAILLGELDFLAEHRPRASLRFIDVDSYTPAADRFIDAASLLLIHGGGNFGDIWPHHHALRLRIIARFGHRKIVQLPQSIHFDDPAALADTARVIAAHPDFTLLVRDARSLDFARHHFACRSELVPDMAFALRPLHRAPARTDCFCLLRGDKEAVADHDAILAALARAGCRVEVADWLAPPRDPASRLDRKLGRVARRVPASLPLLRGTAVSLRRLHATRRVQQGVAMLSRGTQVVTDRLHAHVLCRLLGIPSIAFDSYDGKISAFHATWTSADPGARIARSPADLPALLQPGNRAA